MRYCFCCSARVGYWDVEQHYKRPRLGSLAVVHRAFCGLPKGAI
jgi:hypothetical protein